jgi:hypothetical protein
MVSSLVPTTALSGAKTSLGAIDNIKADVNPFDFFRHFHVHIDWPDGTWSYTRRHH